MSYSMNSFLGMPSEPRILYIYNRLPNQDLDNLALVNHQSNKEVTECYKNNCEKAVPFLNKLSLFFNPLVKMMNNPWKVVITFYNAEPKEKWSVSEKIAKDIAPNFGSLIEKQKFDYQDRINKIEEENRLICGSYYKDPNSPIHIAWIAYENALTPEEKNEYKELENYFNSWHLDENNRILYLNVIEEADKQKIPYSQALRTAGADPKVIRFCELYEKKENAYENYTSLDLKREMLLINKKNLEKEILFRQKILNNSYCLKNFSEEIIYHILYLSPYSTEILSTVPLIKEIKKDIAALRWNSESITEEERQELNNRIKENINRLPPEKSREIWNSLYNQLASLEQKDEKELRIKKLCQNNIFRDLLDGIKIAVQLYRTTEVVQQPDMRDHLFKVFGDFVDYRLKNELSSLIWKSLYDQCAIVKEGSKGEQPYQWAEKHLFEHIDVLYSILLDMKYGKSSRAWSELHFPQHLNQLERVIVQVTYCLGLPDNLDYDPVARFINEEFFEKNKIRVTYPVKKPSYLKILAGL
jgi:hypothetical protein